MEKQPDYKETISFAMGIEDEKRFAELTKIIDKMFFYLDLEDVPNTLLQSSDLSELEKFAIAVHVGIKHGEYEERKSCYYHSMEKMGKKCLEDDEEEQTKERKETQLTLSGYQ